MIKGNTIEKDPISLFFLTPIDATPHENKCNTIDATPVRWLG